MSNKQTEVKWFHVVSVMSVIAAIVIGLFIAIPYYNVWQQ